MTTMLAMNMGERLKEAGFVSLQGMLTIFLVLILLYLAIEVMHALISRASKSAKKAVEPELPVQPDALESSTNEDDGAVVAAIVAAIMAMRSEAGESGAFHVVSFARVGAKRHRS